MRIVFASEALSRQCFGALSVFVLLLFGGLICSFVTPVFPRAARISPFSLSLQYLNVFCLFFSHQKRAAPVLGRTRVICWAASHPELQTLPDSCGRELEESVCPNHPFSSLASGAFPSDSAGLCYADMCSSACSRDKGEGPPKEHGRCCWETGRLFPLCTGGLSSRDPSAELSVQNRPQCASHFVLRFLSVCVSPVASAVAVTSTQREACGP